MSYVRSKSWFYIGFWLGKIALRAAIWISFVFVILATLLVAMWLIQQVATDVYASLQTCTNTLPSSTFILLR